jgi:hypothetical protein
VVLDEETFLVIALKVTSHAPRSGYRGEYEIKRWEDAGLFHIAGGTTSHHQKSVHAEEDGQAP